MDKGFCRCSYLKLMGLDVLPECRDDDRSSLGVNTKQASQTRIQFELERLVVQQQQNSTTDILVT